MTTITDVATLRKTLGDPNPLTKFKIQHSLNQQAQNFIRQSPMLMLSSSTAAGEPTVSPKGDFPGFVVVQDPQTLLIPERQGNNLLFTLQNIVENPNVGLLFMVPATSETLRVQGTATLVTDEELCQRFTARGKPALLVMVVNVKECYFHCAKAFLRSSLWQPESWSQRLKISFAQEIACNYEMNDETSKAFDARVDERYKTTL